MQILQMTMPTAMGGSSIVKPHEFDEDQFLDANEYIEYLNEL